MDQANDPLPQSAEERQPQSDVSPNQDAPLRSQGDGGRNQDIPLQSTQPLPLGLFLCPYKLTTDTSCTDLPRNPGRIVRSATNILHGVVIW